MIGKLTTTTYISVMGPVSYLIEKQETIYLKIILDSYTLSAVNYNS